MDRNYILKGNICYSLDKDNLQIVEKGYELDAVVMQDEMLRCPKKLSIKERLERIIYLSDDRHIAAKYVRGIQVL